MSGPHAPSQARAVPMATWDRIRETHHSQTTEEANSGKESLANDKPCGLCFGLFGPGSLAMSAA